MPAGMEASRDYDARRTVIIAVTVGAAVMLLVLLPPWSPVSPWRSATRLGACPTLTLYIPDGRYSAYGQDLRRRTETRYPGTRVHIDAVDGTEIVNLLGVGDPCAAAISPQTTLTDTQDHLHLLPPVPRNRTDPPARLVSSTSADPSLIAYLASGP
ncbi:hypothetical protein [Frankia sp. KB5]|uniref:hypothetical protein n=1 Tax=Frankia sp. KB5 TaxID=683318 RepID=UPI0010559B4B|nr:hypothetical protein [Frankia sp. KB5]